MRAVLNATAKLHPAAHRVKRAGRPKGRPVRIPSLRTPSPIARRAGSVYVLSPTAPAARPPAGWPSANARRSGGPGSVWYDKEEPLKAILIDLSRRQPGGELDVGGRLRHRLTGLGGSITPPCSGPPSRVLSPRTPPRSWWRPRSSPIPRGAQLVDPAHQERLATGVLAGLRAYFLDAAPARYPARGDEGDGKEFRTSIR